MSNQQVGSVYLRIIDEVVEGSAPNFDEEGVERILLDDLRKTWQQKLSERHVASMPWDPAPMLANTSTVAAGAASATNATVKQEPPVVKQEPTSYPEYPGSSNQSGSRNNVVPATYDTSTAAASARAAQNLQEKFGSVANVQVSQLQAQAQLAQKSNPQQSMNDTRQQYSQQMANTMKQQQQQQRANNMSNLGPPQQRASVASAQTDGANDWNNTVAERHTVSGEASHQADMTLRQQVEQNTLVMEGGGLMQPASKRKASAYPQQAALQKRSRSDVPQLDGTDLGDDVKADPDEDAINSDLDDPDDDAIGETEDDPSTGELMLCTYDKVQRVKNKWKCTLKDGVLTTGGKEYVFGKAQGEFEW